MTMVPLDTLAHGPLAADVARLATSLWVLPGSNRSDVGRLAALPWANVWNFDEGLDFAKVLPKSESRREPIIIGDAADDPETFNARLYVRIYQRPSSVHPPTSPALERIRRDQLKARAEYVGGTLFIVGDSVSHGAEIDLIAELAPLLKLCLVCGALDSNSPVPFHASVYIWTGGLNRLIEEFSYNAQEVDSDPIIDLKDARGIVVPSTVLAELGTDWTLLTRKQMHGVDVDQEMFDKFLNGEPEWPIYAQEGAFLRPLLSPSATTPVGQLGEKVQFPIKVFELVAELDRVEIDPRDALRQLIIFAEPGSGTTTFLRQIAIHVAQSGYPTFLSNPQPKNLTLGALGRVIGKIQDLWWEHRRGPGQGKGRIPAVVLMDKDADGSVDAKTLARVLSSVGREILLIQAVERTRDEMAESKGGAFLLPSDVDESDLLALGAHLRRFAERHSLEPIPSESQWRAYHQGLARVSRYSPVRGTTDEELPHLFLVGLQPFISERVADVNSLEQYFYQKWEQIVSTNIKDVIHTVSAAGSFNLSIPYNALRRHRGLDLSELELPNNPDHRVVEAFLEWRRRGTNLQGWYLRVRHPIVGRLLCRAIDPVDGDVPYAPMLPVLSELTTKADDAWFAETLAFRVGQHFKRKSAAFSVETDTPMQRAARAFFDAIPTPLKEANRTIAHHEARYHIHVVHACLDALRNPSSTTLEPGQVQEILEDETERSSRSLDAALRIRNSLEPESNILNTYARLKFEYAEWLREQNSDAYAETFRQGLDLQEEAIDGDATNGYALYQFVNEIIDVVETRPPGEQVSLLSRAEARLTELIRLHDENRWRNIDPVDAEVQLGVLIGSHLESIQRLPNLHDLLEQVKIRHPEAVLRILIRLTVGTARFEDAFKNSETATKLREYRQQLFDLPNKTPPGLLYLYRLFIVDREGRKVFRARHQLLAELKRRAPEQFYPYWHDEAALLCQLDNLPGGSERFAELRQFRAANEAQWFWMNERVLLTRDGRARPMTLTVIDAADGWARIQNTQVRLRFQPQHFPGLKRNEPFRAYIRFTLYGLQAVQEQAALRDVAALGLS